MIALNEIIKNKELFEKKYALRGKHYDLDKVVSLEKNSRTLQQSTEKMRADCNKLCEKIAMLYNNNEFDDMNLVLEQIRKLDKTISKNTKIYNKRLNKINKIISKFDNIPDFDNQDNIEIVASGGGLDILKLEKFLEQYQNLSYENLSAEKYTKSLENVIADNLPVIKKCKNGYVLFFDYANFESFQAELLKFLKENAQKIVKPACKNLQKQAAAEYLVSLSDKKLLDVVVIREFLARQYKIKYHDKQSDMTKFVSQINIYINHLTAGNKK